MQCLKKALRAACVQALGDLAVRKGIKNLDGLKDPAAAPANPALDPELCQQPLLGILLGVLGYWEELLEQRWQEGEAAPKRGRGRAAQGGRRGAGAGASRVIEWALVTRASNRM